MFYAAATAQAEDMVRRIHDATIALVSLDRQMIGRLAYVAVPDFMYLEYRSLYLELKQPGTAWRSRFSNSAEKRFASFSTMLLYAVMEFSRCDRGNCLSRG